MNEWKEVILGDVTEKGMYGYTESANPEKVGPHFLRITDIQNGMVEWSSVPFCPISDTNKEKYLLHSNDIVVARTGNSTGENFIYEDGPEAVFASYLIRFRILKEVAFPKYVWYNMRSYRWRAFINGFKSGSAQEGANANTLREFPFYLPPISEQKQIAKTLSVLDQKITLLREQNQTLEEFAQTLFKRWFVDFEFPTQTTDSPPFKEEYPQGEVVKKTLNNLKTFRKTLRNNATPAEAKLWTYIKNKQLDGRKFRRQHSIDNYILDFYCPSERIAIELDGEVHNNSMQEECGQERDLFLQNYGIKVLRFDNKVVFEHPDGLLNEVKECFGWVNNHPAPKGAPLLAKEGNSVMGYKSSGGKMVDSELGEIPEGWRVGKLSELLEIKYGKDHKYLLDGPYPVYGSGGVMRYVNEYLYDKPSILLPRKGTLSNIFYLDQPFWSVDTMFYSKILKDDYGKYCYQLLNRVNLSLMDVGSAVPSLTTKILNDMDVLIPSYDIAENFEKIMSSLFNKMNLNNKEIQSLTQLRDTLLPKLMSGELRIKN